MVVIDLGRKLVGMVKLLREGLGKEVGDVMKNREMINGRNSCLVIINEI